MKPIFFSVRFLLLGLATTAIVFSVFNGDDNNALSPTPNTMQEMIAGNKRFSHDHPLHPDQSKRRSSEVSNAQHPQAVIIACSDSRVSPELVFDQGLGDLFVIRTAGNLISEMELGSVEYAVKHLEVPLIVVMGHERCGAVKAMIDDEEADGHLKAIIDSLRNEPEIQAIPMNDEERLDHCVRANINHGVRQLYNQSTIIAERVNKDKLRIIGCRYDLDNRAVTLITHLP